jgi:hypothetical protein
MEDGYLKVATRQSGASEKFCQCETDCYRAGLFSQAHTVYAI